MERLNWRNTRQWWKEEIKRMKKKKNAAENLLKIIGFQASPGVQVTVALIIIHNGLKKGKERNFKVSSHFSAGALTGNSVN